MSLSAIFLHKGHVWTALVHFYTKYTVNFFSINIQLVFIAMGFSSRDSTKLRFKTKFLICSWESVDAQHWLCIVLHILYKRLEWVSLDVLSVEWWWMGCVLEQIPHNKSYMNFDLGWDGTSTPCCSRVNYIYKTESAISIFWIFVKMIGEECFVQCSNN